MIYLFSCDKEQYLTSMQVLPCNIPNMKKPKMMDYSLKKLTDNC